MKKLIDDKRNWMTAITFAEAGEWDTAREFMPVATVNRAISWLHKIFMAVTFAEAGEWQTAQEFIPLVPPSRILNRLETMFMAVALAEAGLNQEAERIMNYPPPAKRPADKDFFASLGLGGIRMTYAVISAA